MTPEEFVVAVSAIHKYVSEKAEKPPEIRRGFSYWKMSARTF
jgi:hypothetical protein